MCVNDLKCAHTPPLQLNFSPPPPHTHTHTAWMFSLHCFTSFSVDHVVLYVIQCWSCYFGSQSVLNMLFWQVIQSWTRFAGHSVLNMLFWQSFRSFECVVVQVIQSWTYYVLQVIQYWTCCFESHSVVLNVLLCKSFSLQHVQQVI